MTELNFLLSLANAGFFVYFLIAIVTRLTSSGVAAVLSAQLWFLVFYWAYICLPAFLVNFAFEIPSLLPFTFSLSSLVVANAIVAITSFTMALITERYRILPWENLVVSDLSRLNILYQICWVILGIYLLLSLSALAHIFQLIMEKGYLLAFFELNEKGDELEAAYHFFSLRYLVIPCAFYLYSRTKKEAVLLFFLPNIVFEILSGKRTSAFIYILFIYLILVIRYRKTFLWQMSLVLGLLLVSVLFSRMSSMLQNYNSVLDFESLVIGAFAEFINTYLTLIHIIDHDLVGNRQIHELIFDYTSGLLPGVMTYGIMNAFQIKEFGDSIALSIGLGYGFGCNALSFFVGTLGYIGVLGVPAIYMLTIHHDRRVRGFPNFVLTFYLIIQLRLFMRQGFASFEVYYYLVLVYLSWFLLFRHKPANSPSPKTCVQ